MPRHLFLSLLALSLLLSASASAAPADSLSLYWDVDLNIFFDNREGDSRYVDTRTFFLTRLAPEIGASFRSDGASHRIAGGAVWAQPIGSEWDGYRISPTLYYRYERRNGLAASIGMFGREQLISPMPDYVWSDSASYWQRNIRGAMIQYSSSRGFFEAFLDWRGMQSHTRREAFNIIAHGEWRSPSHLVAGGLAMMNHLARSADAGPEQHVVDNFILNPYVGLQYLSSHPLSAYCHIGILASLTRDRGDSDWLPRAGLWLDAQASWRWLSIQNTLYAGKPLFPLYHRYGSLLDQGSPYYASPWTDRLALAAALISTPHVNLSASLDFHFAKSNLTSYQRLILTITLP